ncbi:MAG: RNA polymerase factor sigma-54 [Clostridiaceae bacterium]|nr:RNA polymerase factor sigma-54 [Clostridiaceae bacterium]
MDFYFDLSLIQSQKIILTPQLRQALEILKMNSQELTSYIQNEMETNPAMEISSGYSVLQEDILPINMEDEDKEAYYNNEGDYPQNVHDQDFYKGIRVDRSTGMLSLKEHLLVQLHTSDIEQGEIEVGEYLIDNVDRSGYLSIDISEAADYFNIPVKKVENTLKLLQTFDPPGVCARDLKESLIIQMKQGGICSLDVLKVVKNHLDDLAANKLTLVARKTGLSIDRINEILELIKTFEPRPGREFYNCEDTRYIVPDVIINNINGKYEVIINEDSIPIINVNSYYRNILKEDINVEAKKFIQSRIDSLNWLVKCIQQRKDTLIKVAECILNKQKEFFDKGRMYIKPLTMKELARELKIHESTVSRTVSSKYLQCSWGIFELRYFFPLKFSSTQTQTTCEKIKVIIRNIVNSEDKKNPRSDNAIAQLLKDQGIDISRRTVAKYRMEINIPPATKRKKH